MALAVATMLAATLLSASGPEIPVVFAPGVISSAAHDSAPAFTPDGRTVYFTRSSGTASFILVSQRTASNWSKPAIASFSGKWLDMEPAMAPDGSYLIFVSNRPALEGGQPLDGMINGQAQPRKGANLWRVKRMASGWGKPERLPDIINSGPSTYAPSVAANGDIYFMHPDGAKNRFRLFMAAFHDGTYEVPASLSFSTGEETDVDPAILPDESAIVFGSGRHTKTDIDLFIAHRIEGRWSEPVYLGDSINSPTSDAEPRWGADHHTLYFSSERIQPVPQPVPTGTAKWVLNDMTGWNNGQYNIWWVDLAAQLKP